ncbi:MAG: hypothetical protein IVW56_05245 [Candidatus Binataceae bacterium]|nr:hypothetical protein [Candidatus Binataceae bacterium]
MHASSVSGLGAARDRLAHLYEQGDAVLRSYYRSELSFQDFVDAALFRAWRVGCLAFLQEAFGAESHYLREFESSCDSPYLSAAARGQAVLRAAREYIDAGPVTRVDELAAAEVLNDLIAIADGHLKHGHLVAAAAVAGAIVEDVLRRNARLRKLGVSEHAGGIAALNQRLWQAGVYPVAMRRKVDGWAALAEAAAAGALGEEARAEVVAMVRGLRSLVADHLI